jgi:outer membrane receptor protein involved in Fe transport
LLTCRGRRSYGRAVESRLDPQWLYDLVHPGLLHEPGYSLLDARIAYQLRNYEFAFVGKNLTGTEANLGDNRSLAAETVGRPRLVVNAPRTLGVGVRAKF